MKKIGTGNTTKKEVLDAVCIELEKGERVEIITNVIGHGLNNQIQDEYKARLTNKYGDRLIVETEESVCRISHIFSLKGIK